MKRGIFSGTFDPIHLGHISFAKQALSFGLDRIIFMPEPEPRRKKNVTPLVDRLAMIDLAIATNPKFESFVPEDHKNHSPAETGKLLERKYKATTGYTILLGGDVFEHVPRWIADDKDASQLEYIRSFEYFVGLRTEDDGELAIKIKKQLNINAALVISDFPKTASKTIRRNLKAGKEPKGLDSEVFEYIKKRKLYGVK